MQGVRYSTQVWVSNDSNAERRFTTRFVANNHDGTKNVHAGAARDPSVPLGVLPKPALADRLLDRVADLCADPCQR